MRKADPQKRPTSTREINAYLAANGLGDYEFCRESGYFHLCSEKDNPKPYGHPSLWYTSSVPVCYCTDQTLDGWLKDAISLGEEGKDSL